MASSKAFHLIIERVVNIFIGLPTGDIKRTTPTDCVTTKRASNVNNDFVLAAAFEEHLASRTGFLGIAQGFYGVFEAQAQGALHMHAVV